MKKKPTKKKVVKKKGVRKTTQKTKPKTRVKKVKLTTRISKKIERAVENKMVRMKNWTKKQEQEDTIYKINPYAPGTWDVVYVQYENSKNFSPRFYKLSPNKIKENRERILSLPKVHEETVEEIMEHLKFKK